MTEARTGFEEDSGPPRSWGEAVESAPACGGMTEPGVDPAGVKGAVNVQHDLEPVAKCRERSKSIWIHFPHVELVFLLYGVQGSLAAQLAVLRHGDGVVFYVGAIALVSTFFVDVPRSSTYLASNLIPTKTQPLADIIVVEHPWDVATRAAQHAIETAPAHPTMDACLDSCPFWTFVFFRSPAPPPGVASWLSSCGLQILRGDGVSTLFPRAAPFYSRSAEYNFYFRMCTS